MSKKIQLAIAEPCHENWDNMTTSDKGKFCGACQKQVVDFTNMSDTQMASFFKKPSTGSVCGRFMNDQLDRDITIPRKRIPWIKYFFQLSLPLFLASLKATAQRVKAPVKQTATTASSSKLVIMGEYAPVMMKEDFINGKVIDQEGKPIPYASVLIKDSHVGVPADSLGSFNLRMPDTADSVTVTISSVGFQEKEMIVTRGDLTKQPILSIQLEKQVLPGITVPSSAYDMIGAVVITKKFSRKKTPVISKPISKPSIMTIYPNPVSSGAAIHIDCSKMEESYYSFQLLTMSGSVAIQKEIWIDKEATVYNMPVPSIAAGMYIIKMVSKTTGKSYSDKLIIQ